MTEKNIRPTLKNTKCQVSLKNLLNNCTKFSLLFFFSFSAGADVPPPGEEALIPREPIIFKVFDQFREAPLIGLEYIVEIIHGPNVDPTYECLLCRTTLRANDVLSDVISAQHRLNYLVSPAFGFFI